MPPDGRCVADFHLLLHAGVSAALSPEALKATCRAIASGGARAAVSARARKEREAAFAEAERLLYAAAGLPQ